MNTELDCAADGERAMDMQAKTQCLGLFYQIDFAAHFLELLQPELQSTSEGSCCSLRIVFMRNQSVYNGC
jgi:hypothetical protein